MLFKTIIFVFFVFQLSRCNGNGVGITEWTVPLLNTGEKQFYLGIFFKANWFKAEQYCRYHGMHLVSISSQEENDKLEGAITDLIGYNNEGFWTSGNDYAEKGKTPRKFFWMSNGRPITFVNWGNNEPNNLENKEDCIELNMKNGLNLKWNDISCFEERYFICEVQTQVQNYL